MNFDNCNYVISNASSLISSLLNNAVSSSPQGDLGLPTDTTTMNPVSSQSQGGFGETIMVVIGFLLLLVFLGQNLKKKQKTKTACGQPIEKHTPQRPTEN